MEVFRLHHETSRALCKLPDEVKSIVEEFICPTKLNWRDCRIHESRLIKELRESLFSSVVEPTELDWVFDSFTTREMTTWSMFGILYLLKWLHSGGIDRFGRPPRQRPSDFLINYFVDDYDKWYTHTFMWFAHC
jgi:hypothetical protein